MTREEKLELLNKLLEIEEKNDVGNLTRAERGEFQQWVKALEQEPNTWSLDDAREDFMYDVYNTLDFLPTNEEANKIIDIFDKVTSGLEQEPILDKIRAEVEQLPTKTRTNWNGCCPDINYPEIEYIDVSKKRLLHIIDKYKEESEG